MKTKKTAESRIIIPILGIVIGASLSTLTMLVLGPIKTREIYMDQKIEECLSTPHARFVYESSVDRAGRRVEFGTCHLMSIDLWRTGG